MKITSLRTPCVLIEHPKVERNIERMQTAADAHGKRLRPHAKTHKSSDLAALQIARGAVGICCAKLGEAEVFAEHGVRDIRLPYPLHPVNGDRLLALLDRTHLSFIVDDLEVARGWSDFLHSAGSTVDVLVKVDVGFHRCGIDPSPAGACDFVRRVADLPGLRMKGLLSHPGHAYGTGSSDEIREIARQEGRQLNAIREALSAYGVAIDELSVGSTPTARHSLEIDGVTEIRPGNYIYYDRMQVELGSAAWEDCALTVLARVVSRPAADRLILDSGSKSLTTDQVRGFRGATGYGAVLQSLTSAQPDETLVIERLSEEHATVRALDATMLAPGDLVRVVPNHACVVSNLVDEGWIVSGGDVLDRLRIDARGLIT